jgi:hypothetical protein
VGAKSIQKGLYSMFAPVFIPDGKLLKYASQFIEGGIAEKPIQKSNTILLKSNTAQGYFRKLIAGS